MNDPESPKVGAVGDPQDEREDLSAMMQDVRLSRACACTCIALMGFPSIKAFEEWSENKNRVVDGRVDLVRGWLTAASGVGVDSANGSAGGPMSTGVILSPESTKNKLAAMSERELHEYWTRPVDPEYKPTASDKVYAAIAPLLAMDAGMVDGEDAWVNDYVHNVASMLNATAGEIDFLTEMQLQEFSAFVKECKDACSRNGSEAGVKMGIGHFAALIRAVVRGVPRTTDERSDAALAASVFYHGDWDVIMDKSRKARLIVAAREQLPMILGRVRFKEWSSPERVATLVEQACQTLSTGTDGIDNVIQAYNVLLRSPRRLLVSPSETGSSKILEHMASTLRGACVTVPSGVDTAGALHTAARSILQGSDDPEKYMQLVRDENWHEANLFVLSSVESGEFLRAMKNVMSKRISASALPAELKLDIAKEYSEATCAGMHEIMGRVALIEQYAPDFSSQAALPEPAQFRDALEKKIREIALNDLRIRLANVKGADSSNVLADPVSANLLEGLIALRPTEATVVASLRALHKYLRDVIAWRDDVHPVRVAITLRTGGYGKGLDAVALENARDMVASNTPDKITPTWSGEHVRVTFPKGTEYGPFYNVMLNGHDVKSSIEGHLGKIWHALAVASDPATENSSKPNGSILHYVYSAYGLSGAGKTTTLLKGADSILQAIVDQHRTATICSREGVRACFSVTDVYGEAKLDGDEECQNMAPREHIVTYGPSAFHGTGLWVRDAYKKFGRGDGQAGPAQHTWIPLVSIKSDHDDKSVVMSELPECINRLTMAKQVHNFAAQGENPIFHVRATPNNVESSRAHSAITLKFTVRDAEIARITLLDMAGSEDVKAIHNAYRKVIELQGTVMKSSTKNANPVERLGAVLTGTLNQTAGNRTTNQLNGLVQSRSDRGWIQNGQDPDPDATGGTVCEYGNPRRIDEMGCVVSPPQPCQKHQQ